MLNYTVPYIYIYLFKTERDYMLNIMYYVFFTVYIKYTYHILHIVYHIFYNKIRIIQCITKSVFSGKKRCMDFGM